MSNPIKLLNEEDLTLFIKQLASLRNKWLDRSQFADCLHKHCSGQPKEFYDVQSKILDNCSLELYRLIERFEIDLNNYE